MSRRLLRLSHCAIACALVIAASTSAAQAPRRSLADNPRVAQSLELAKIWLDGQRAYEQIPGISVAIVHDQQVVWSGGFGYADVARRAPATPSTIYSICSISKLFTSVATLQLRDAGKLRLDDPVAKHLSWFAIKRAFPDAPEITIEGLLTHSSGLPRESDYPYWSGPDFAFPTHEQIVAKISNQETLYPAERYFQYSNLGLTLAGEVVAAASGQPYDTYIKSHILEPLRMQSTRTDMPETERNGRLATGYGSLTRDGSRRPAPFYLARGIAPAAGYSSTAEDLAKFASWQFRLLSGGDGNGVLKASTLRQMQRVHFIDPDWQTSYGLGFAVRRVDDKTFVGHGGSCPGYRTELLMQPQEKIATIVMANAQGVNTGQLAQKLYEIVAPALRAAAKDSAPAKQPDATLARYAGRYESGFSGESNIIPWEDGLAMLSLPTSEPMRGLTKLKKVGEHTFRRVRRDDELGEQIVFQMGPDGSPARMIWNSNNYQRVAPAGMVAELQAKRTDVESVDAILASLYDVISGPAGQRRDWNRFRSLFAPGARLIPTGVRPDGSKAMRVMTPEDYVAGSGPALERSGFFEREIARRSDRFGNVLHVFSTYESRRTPADSAPFARGINSIQLFNDGTRWWVMTILWDSERKDNPIPANYLRTVGAGQ